MSQALAPRKFGTAPFFYCHIDYSGSGYVSEIWVRSRLSRAIGHPRYCSCWPYGDDPTAMAIAEIATNQKVEGGGEYYIISRSFGLVIGSSIGIALYFSQAISVAFYIIAFSEAFGSLFEFLKSNYELHPWVEWLLDRKQTVSIQLCFY